jgi:hypothetical protein
MVPVKKSAGAEVTLLAECDSHDGVDDDARFDAVLNGHHCMGRSTSFEYRE